MKTKEEILKETGIQWDRLNKELPLLSSKILRAVEMYNTEQLKNLDLHIVSNCKALYKCPCGLETNDYLKWKNCDCKNS